MRMASAVAVAILLAIAPQLAVAGPLANLESEQRSIYQKVSSAVVYISTKEGIGSGFFVRPGIIVTNAHVVDKQKTVEVVTRGGTVLQGTAIAHAPDEIDLVLLQVSQTNHPLLTLTTANLSIGDWAASVGHGVDSPWSYTTGMVSNIFTKGRNKPIFQTQIPLNPGNSGGPIVDRHGHVIGVVTSGMPSSNNVNFAIHSTEVVKAFPQQLRQSSGRLRITAPAGVAILIDGEFVDTGPSVAVPVADGKHQITVSIDGGIQQRDIVYPEVTNVVF